MCFNYYNRKVNLKDENLTNGDVLCKIKNNVLVKLTPLKDVNINASQIQLYLHSKEELKRKLIEWSEIAPGFT